MAHGSKACLLGLLLLAGTASAVTVGPLQGRPVPGRPLEVNIPFAVDQPADRACASANVRYGNTPTRMTLHVQGQGLKRNLLVTSRANVGEQPVLINVRVGCGRKAVTRSFIVATGVPALKRMALVEPSARQAAPEPVGKPARKPPALRMPSEPLFPPPSTEAVPQQDNNATPADPSLAEELRKARAEAAAAIAQLAATRRELAAVLDVERRTAQTLINADHQVRDARSDADRMRLVLKWLGAALGLAAAGIAWLEFQRVTSMRRGSRERPAQEPGILSGAEMPT